VQTKILSSVNGAATVLHSYFVCTLLCLLNPYKVNHVQRFTFYVVRFASNGRRSISAARRTSAAEK
jgi:hypothetical protein